MSPIFKLFALLNLSLYAMAQGTQFITGECASDAECASACCGFTSGKCAAPFVANERGEGCGFGDAQPNNNALNGAEGNARAEAQPGAAAPGEAPAANGTAGETDANAGAGAGAGAAAGDGTQFITGPCTADSDCASACCGFKSGTGRTEPGEERPSFDSFNEAIILVKTVTTGWKK
ncbi:biotrophy-associated secreted protein 2 [Stemphylium lycopersici]|uniref:Biotrophy-associated secreted protein 2 n=1 Tax=Stemphylium lycopersici TaxID=183478 RepID=A0A364N604_STELY|nr:biotrophy-associated secreted protein 2 [Stemphylium lycopersici]